MSRRLAPPLAVLVAAGVLAGCGVAPEEPPATPPVPAPAGPTLPPRPQEVPVAGVDPCGLVPPTVLVQAGLPPRGEQRPLTPQTPLILTCEWDNFPTRPGLTLTVDTVPDQDTAGFLRFEEAVPDSVAGFGAVEGVRGLIRPPRELSCMLRIDVAAGQGLWVTVNNMLGDLPGVNHEVMCQKAHGFAEAIMANLLARTR